MNRGDHVGYIINIAAGTSTPSTASLGFSRCIDTVGNYEGPNGLDIEHNILSPGLITGQEAVWPVYGFDKCPYTNQPVPDHTSGWDLGKPSDSAAMTQLLAWTNPSRAEVSMLNFLFELRELPAMLLSKGKKHREDHRAQLDARRRRRGIYDPKSKQWVDHPDYIPETSNSVAEYNFGWDLLFRDVYKMLQFTHYVDKRTKELTRLYKTGLHRQRVIWNASHTAVQDGVTFNSFVCGASGKRVTTTRARQWASCVWRPLSPDPAIPSSDQIRAKAMSLVHGWRPDPYVVWQALPWSWMIDWFGNIGDILAATQNIVEFFPFNCCVMTQITTDIEDVILSSSPGFTVIPAKRRYEQKFRALSSIGFNIRMPLLGLKQLTTILGIANNYRKPI